MYDRAPRIVIIPPLGRMVIEAAQYAAYSFTAAVLAPVVAAVGAANAVVDTAQALTNIAVGSFFGGGMRYWISKLVQSCTVIAFPFGTMAVNVAGCLIIGFLSGLNWREGGWMSPSAKLLLTTGFCGGFTTFSTFINEGAGLMKEENYLYMMLYLFGSLALGLLAVLAGHYLAKCIA